jgi:hypothetical protein
MNPHDYQWYFTNPQLVGKYSFIDEHKVYSKNNSPIKKKDSNYENVKYVNIDSI